LKKVFLIAFFLLLFQISSFSQSEFNSHLPIDYILNEDKMRKDLDFLVQILKEVHPATYYGFSEKQRKIINKAYEKIKTPMSVDNFYFVLNTILWSFNDAHTSLWYKLSENDKILDVPIIWLKDGLYISEDREMFKKGDKIIEISGKTPGQILMMLEQIIPSENIYFIKARAETELLKEVYLKKLNLVNNGFVTIKIRRNWNILTFKVPLVKYTVSDKKKDEQFVNYYIDKDSNIAVFKLDKCIYDIKYIKAVKNFFQEVSENKIDKVIVDLSKNPGGNSRVVYEFLRFIDVDDIRTYGWIIRYSKQLSEKLFLTKKEGLERFESTLYKNNKFYKKSILFNGKTYVMISKYTSSSAIIFATTLKDNNIAKIIGEPSGNSPSHFGSIITFRLPVTNFIFSVSTTKLLRPQKDERDKKTLFPDVVIYTTIDDIVNDVSIIEKAKKVINF